MKKLFLVIGLSLPLLAQGTETDIEISKQEQRVNRASKVVKTFSPFKLKVDMKKGRKGKKPIMWTREDKK